MGILGAINRMDNYSGDKIFNYPMSTLITAIPKIYEGGMVAKMYGRMIRNQSYGAAAHVYCFEHRISMQDRRVQHTYTIQATGPASCKVNLNVHFMGENKMNNAKHVWNSCMKYIEGEIAKMPASAKAAPKVAAQPAPKPVMVPPPVPAPAKPESLEVKKQPVQAEAPIEAPAPVETPAPAKVEPQIKYVYVTRPAPKAVPAKGSKKSATVGFVFGLLSLVFTLLVLLGQALGLLLWLVGFLLAPIGVFVSIMDIVFAAVSLAQCKKGRGYTLAKVGKPLAIVGLIFSIFALIGAILALIIYPTFVLIGVLVYVAFTYGPQIAESLGIVTALFLL